MHRRLVIYNQTQINCALLSCFTCAKAKRSRFLNFLKTEFSNLIHFSCFVLVTDVVVYTRDVRRRGGVMVSALDLDRAVLVRALAGDIALSTWARHFTLTVNISTQVYK